MKIKYSALERLIIEPLVLKVAATSGTAASTAVDEIGARNPQNDRMAVIKIFLLGVNLLYTASPISAYLSPGTTGDAAVDIS